MATRCSGLFPGTPRSATLAIVRLLCATLALVCSLACGAACGGSDDTSSSSGSSSSGGTTKPEGVPYDYPLDDVLRVNHLQAKGTHNSYHVFTEDSSIPSWMYTHVPLDEQLSAQGVRSFELDTRYIEASERFEVFHLGLVDEATTCRVFVDCLSALEGWSARFPGHHPLFVMLEPKDAPPDPGAEDYFARLEGEILSVWPRERILTPDDVKGDSATLREAILSKGWPTLGEARGKILFFVNNTDTFRDPYTHGGKDLDGRLMFVESSPDDPFAATVILNDPSGDGAAIESAVEAGFLVRTFADSAPAGDPVERDLAIASGAHLLSSDFPAPVESGGYSLEIPGGTPSRCNPLVAPPECTSKDIEDPAFTKDP